MNRPAGQGVTIKLNKMEIQFNASVAYPHSALPMKFRVKHRKMTRRQVAEDKYNNNSFSDEYYTRTSWDRFIQDYGLEGKTVVEPFAGDGSFIEHLRQKVNVVTTNANYWDVLEAGTLPEGFIMSNPPFSCKWEIIESLLEMRRDFALILPWQVWTNKRLHMLHGIYGGTHTKYNLKGHEKMFYNPRTNKMEVIGVYILVWKF